MVTRILLIGKLLGECSKIKAFLSMEAPILCLTATCNLSNQEMLLKCIEIPNATIIRGNINRAELYYVSKSVSVKF